MTQRHGAPQVRHVAALSAWLWILTLVPAIAVAVVPDAAHTLRSHLAFALTPYGGSLGEVVEIATSNARVVLAIALAAWVRSQVPALSPVTDVLVGVIVLANTLLVGIAVGAYGLATVPWLVHLPVEWCALAVVLALQRADRRRTPNALAWSVTTAMALALVAVGALVEAYMTPQE